MLLEGSDIEITERTMRFFASSLSVRHCVQCLERVFTTCQVEEAMCSAEYIVASVLGLKTMHGVHPKTAVSVNSWNKAKRMAKERLQHKPIQYIVGDWDFRHLTLEMKAPVLIPRPETEELVDHILDGIPAKKEVKFLEIGSGSGAICLSLLHEHPIATATAIDISADSCDLTLVNARKYDLDRRLTVMNISLHDYSKLDVGKLQFDFIVSNPPYIPKADMANLHPQVKNYEDEIALYGGSDGLDLIKPILQLAPHILKSGHFHGQGSVWLEVDSTHPPLIERYVTDHVPSLLYHRTITDMFERPRFCHLSVTKNS